MNARGNERKARALQLFTEFSLALLGGLNLVVFLHVAGAPPERIAPALATLVLLFGILYALMLRTISGYQGVPRMLWLAAGMPFFVSSQLWTNGRLGASSRDFLICVLSAYFGWFIIWWTCRDEA